MKDAWQIRWIDNTLHSGDSASDILASVASTMWKSEDKPKEALAYRVWTLLREEVDASLPDDQFLQRLADIELISIISKPS